MKILIDFFPIILFFIAYKAYDIFVATGVAIVASALQVGYSRWKHGRFETMHLVTLALIGIFGGATLLFQDQQFIMWKPTVLNWLFGLVFLGSHFIGDKLLAERLMSKTIQVPALIWTRLNISWVVFFFAVGLANLYVANLFFQAEAALELAAGAAALGDEATKHNCGERFQGTVLNLCLAAEAREQDWVNFKLFGMLGLTFAFVIGQAFYLARHVSDQGPAGDADQREG